MGNVLTMAQRELGAYFLSPIAYVVYTVFLAATGMAFGYGVFGPGKEASLRGLLDWMLLIFALVIPMITMRLVSDELRTGTIETLMTAPITDTEVVIGKFIGALSFLAALLGSMIVYPVILMFYGEIDVWLFLCNLLGLLLTGSLFVSIGLFVSSWTRHQVVAIVLSLIPLLVMTFGFERLSGEFEGTVRDILQQLAIRTHFHTFIIGVVDLNHLVFFVSMTALFLFLTVRRMEVRRWQ